MSGDRPREESLWDPSRPGRRAFEWPPLDVPHRAPLRYARATPAELPELAEIDVERHFTRLSRCNEAGPLGRLLGGSARYVPRLSEEIARLPGWTEWHPDFPLEYSQGACEAIFTLERLLAAVSGMDEVTTQPIEGLSSQVTALQIIRAFHEQHASYRRQILVPENELDRYSDACELTGYEARPVGLSPSGHLGMDPLTPMLSDREIAALWIRIPNAAGLFEPEIREIAELVHGMGAQVLVDGSEMNTLLGTLRARDLGTDLLQWDLHGSFAVPRGPAGPDCGALLVRSHLAPYLPGPKIVRVGANYGLEEPPHSVGRVREGFGNFGVCLRALISLMRQGSQGLKQQARAAALNTGYLRHRLRLAEKASPIIAFDGSDGWPTEAETLAGLNEIVEALKAAGPYGSKEREFGEIPAKSVLGEMGALGTERKPVLSLDDRNP